MDPVRLACVKHAASVRPEPGSNSPSKISLPIVRSFRTEHVVVRLFWKAGCFATEAGNQLAQNGYASSGFRHQTLSVKCIDFLDVHPRRNERPALTFGYLCFVFKEQGGRQLHTLLGAEVRLRRRSTVAPDFAVADSLVLATRAKSPFAAH